MQTKSRRARRMERHHAMRKGAPLNLVSLMDIFTILVFFLLVNSSSAPQLPDQKDLQLPKSTAQKAPKETLVLAVTTDALLLQGKQVAQVKDLLTEDDDIIEQLLQALQERAAPEPAGEDAESGRAITIMADENLPYELVRKLLATSQQAGFTDIAFAAHQKAQPALEN